MLKDIANREKILAVMTIGIALTAIVYNILRDEIREKEVLLAKHRRILRNKDVITELNAEYSKFFQKRELTPEEESAAALSSIEKQARDANVHITNIKPLGVKKLQNYNKFTYRVSAESGIGGLTKFIYNIHSSEQLLKVERMVLRAKERDPGTIKAMLHITKISVF